MIDPLTAATLAILLVMAGVLASAACWFAGYDCGGRDEFMRNHKPKGKKWHADGK